MDACTRLFISDYFEIYDGVLDCFRQLGEALLAAKRVLSGEEVKESGSQRPDVCLRAERSSIFLLLLEQLGRKVHKCVYLQIASLDDRLNAKVYQCGLMVPPDHDVVRLDIAVNKFSDLLQVFKRFQHVDEIVSCLPYGKALRLPITPRPCDVGPALDLVFKTAALEILRYEEEVLVIFDYFVQSRHVGVLQILESLSLIYNFIFIFLLDELFLELFYNILLLCFLTLI